MSDESPVDWVVTTFVLIGIVILVWSWTII